VRRRVIVVDGPLAFRMRRLEAARAGHTGLEVTTLPQLAARLVGGFCRVADRAVLSPAIATALNQGGFAEIETVRSLPGMVRAALQTLNRVWAADLDIEALASRSARVRDLCLIQQRVRAALPVGVMLPRDVRDTAIAHSRLSPALLGSVTLEGLSDVDHLWRPLLIALTAHIDVVWKASGVTEHTWFPGSLSLAQRKPRGTIEGDLCADPRAEVVESLRWARETLSCGDVNASDVAIAAVSPATYDDHILVLARDADLPIHFSHGIPALSTWEGQICAALADILSNGLSQERVRRLLRQTSAPLTDTLPEDWASGLPRRAGLFSVEQWRQALRASREHRQTPEAAERALLPVLEMLSRGFSCAEEAGRLVLNKASHALWRDALQMAPPSALTFSLQSLRIRDERDPGNSIVWCPASHLAGAPRPRIRLLGLGGRAWPRVESEDSLLPNHILNRRELIPVSITERDRREFEILIGQAAENAVVSRSHRSAEGAVLCASTLWPAASKPNVKTRARLPEHAFSEADRLLARPADAGQSPRIRLSRACWRAWHSPKATPHDGALRSGHPTIARAVERLHSPTSLKRLVRDPLGFVWRYALNMSSAPLLQQPLSLDPLSFGNLVHELIRRTINALEPDPGFVRASHDAIEIALAAAVALVEDQWPLQQPVPPTLLWKSTLKKAAALAFRGLTLDESFQPGTRSWTEVEFGDTGGTGANTPWANRGDVLIGEARLRVGGRIDRIDLAVNGAAVRITDYKTGDAPSNISDIVIAGGKELQRVVYAMAAQQLRPEATAIVSRLVFLGADSTSYQLKGPSIHAAASDLSRYVDIAVALLRSGSACPGPDAQDPYSDLRLALPADLNRYLERKATAFGRMRGELSSLWMKP
jgi:PD-(D/E)XK nuclease superfamily